jgi:hypothetical protein
MVLFYAHLCWPRRLSLRALSPSFRHHIITSLISIIAKTMNNLISSIKSTLIELNAVLLLMDDAQFSKPLTLFSGSSVGMHARHIIEFYQCLLFQSESGGIVNYDKRKRDLLLQSKLEYFTLMVNVLIEAIERLDDATLKAPLSITNDSEHGDAEIIGSNLARELHYNLEHTIHHAAFIKIGVLCLVPDAQLPKTFGIAPSTLRHQEVKITPPSITV